MVRGRARWFLRALLLATALPATAEAGVGVKLRLFETLTRVETDRWGLFTLGSARVSLQASTDTVKAELAADALMGTSFVPSLARAWLAARFPGFRLTLGKTALPWGEGLAFNAGDLVFGSNTAAGLDLAAQTPRDDAAWMAALYVPLGRFAFAEAVALPPVLDVAALLENPTLPLPDPGDTSLGARFVGRLGGIKIEPAYLWRGETGLHTVSLTLQGNLLVDWHLSGSAVLAADLAQSIRLSAGLFHLQRLGDVARLSLRLEAIVAPAGDWTEVEPPVVPVYGLLLYPEIALSLDALGFSLRSVVSPVDLSATLVPGVSLSVHKGLAFLAMGTIGLGDATDTWSPRRQGGLSVLLGATYTW